jgi:hypothetical protein
MWDIPRVITTKADDRKRVVVPQAKAGQVYDVHSQRGRLFYAYAFEAGASGTALCADGETRKIDGGSFGWAD